MSEYRIDDETSGDHEGTQILGVCKVDHVNSRAVALPLCIWTFGACASRHSDNPT